MKNHQLDPITQFLIVEHLRRISRALARQAAEAEGLLESAKRLDDIAEILAKQRQTDAGGQD